MTSSRTLASTSTTMASRSSMSRSSMRSSDDDSNSTTRSFRQLRRNLTSELNLNATLFDELKAKDDEIGGLYTELSILKDRLHEYEYTSDGGSNTHLTRPLNKIKSLLNASTTVMAYNAVDVHLNPAIDHDDEIYIMHKIIAMKNELLRSNKEMKKLKENISKYKLSRGAANSSDIEEPEVTQVLLCMDNGNSASGDVSSSEEPVSRINTLSNDYESLSKKLELLLEENIKQREEVQKYISEKNEATALLQRSRKDIKTITNKYESAKKGNSVLRKELTAIKKQLVILENELLELNNDNEKLQNDYNELQTNMNDSTSAQSSSKTSDMKRAKREIKEKQLEINKITGEKELLERNLKYSQEQIDALEKELNERQQDKMKMDEEFERISKANKTLESELTTLKAQCQHLKDSLDNSQKECADAKKELEAVKAEKNKMISKVDKKFDKKILELKMLFKESIRQIISSLEGNVNVVKNENETGIGGVNQSVVTVTVTSGDASSASKPGVTEVSPVDDIAVSALNVNEHDKQLSIQVMSLVNKLADEIFIDGSVKLDIANEMELVTSDHSMKSNFSGGSSHIDVKQHSDVLIGVLHQGLNDIKALSSQGKFKSSRSKRKHEIVDDLLQKIENEKQKSSMDLLAVSK